MPRREEFSGLEIERVSMPGGIEGNTTRVCCLAVSSYAESPTRGSTLNNERKIRGHPNTTGIRKEEGEHEE